MIRHSAPCLGTEEEEAATRVIRSNYLAQGPEVEAFERECADFFHRKHAVAVNSGTAALHLALAALGVTEGDPVALPAYACASLITAVRLQRGRSVLCDIGPDYVLAPDGLPPEAHAVIVAHLFGASGSLPAHDAVIEDIAQSMGGPTGASSPVAITSFYATKMITTGEGGMLLTDDEALAEYARDRRDYDNRDDWVERYNYKMTDLQAAVGRVQLRRLPEFLARRRAIAERYSEAFAGLPLALPNPEGHVFFRYVIATDRREALETHLANQGIEAKRPVYRPAHHYLGGEIPASERAHQQCLSLPIYPSLLDAQLERVIESVLAFWNE